MKQKIAKFVRLRKGVILLIIFSLIVAIAITGIVKHIGKPHIESYEPTSQFTISNETRKFDFPIRTTGPSYFASIGRIYVCLSSPYADFFKTFEVEMSLDNVSWVKIPLLNDTSFQKNNYSKYADLGLIELGGLVITIYGKYYIPPQTLLEPSNASKEDISNSFRGYVTIKKETSPRDRTIEFLVFLTLFGATLGVGDLLFLSKKAEEGGANRHNMKPVSTTLAIWILGLPIALFVMVFAAILVLFSESLDGSSILSTFSALVSTVLVILLVWERLRDSLSEKLKYVFEIWLLSMHRRLRDKRQFFDSQDALRKYKDDLGKYGKFINISLYPEHFLVEINEFLTMHKEFYKRLRSIERLATDRIGQHDLNRDLLHGLVGLTSWTQARNPKEMKAHEEICKTIKSEQAKTIEEMKEYLEKLEQKRKALFEKLEDFIMTNGLSKKVGGASLVP